MTTADALRGFYARFVATSAGVEDARIIDAFTAVRREQFVGRGPWQIKVPNGYISTETDNPAVLYQDILVGLIPEKGINNGEPGLHAKCLGAAAPQAGDTILHVGAGTGYYTAILAHLAGDEGRVYAYELEPALADRAAANLATHGSVTVRGESGLGAPLPMANVIYVSAGVTHVPALWLDALAPAGRLVLPLTPDERLGCMLLVTRRSETAFGARVFSTAGFIGCVGARDEVQSRILAAALDARSVDEIRSLRRGGEPDHTAWCVGDGWWLSTAEPS